MAPLYDYKALSPTGKTQKGTVDSETIKSARVKLKKQGLLVTEIREKSSQRSGGSSGGSLFGGRIGMKDVSAITRQLASLVKSNIPLVDALNALVEQTDNPALKVVLATLRQDVNEGSSFAKATAKHPKVFDTIYINMIEAGESSGTLGLVLIKLADLKEAQVRLRNKLTSSMMYPGLMMLVAIGLVIGIFAFVIPQLAKIFESMNKPMPPMTLVMIGISDVLTNYWYAFLFATVAAGYFFRKYINTEAGRERWDNFKLNAPIFGPLIRISAITRFASTMSTLLESGVPIVAAMNIARNLVDNVPIAKAIATARENITEGQSIAEPLKRSGMFPPMVIHMISIGEKTGELPSMLKNVADTYEEQLTTKIEGLTSLLEPLMIVGMGAVVGLIVMTVFVPLLDLSNISTG